MAWKHCRRDGCNNAPWERSPKHLCKKHDLERRERSNRTAALPRCECGEIIPRIHTQEGIPRCRYCEAELQEKLAEAQRHNEIHDALDACSDLDELKSFIRDHLINH